MKRIGALETEGRAPRWPTSTGARRSSRARVVSRHRDVLAAVEAGGARDRRPGRRAAERLAAGGRVVYAGAGSAG